MHDKDIVAVFMAAIPEIQGEYSLKILRIVNC
jgi:hypothetical protein